MYIRLGNTNINYSSSKNDFIIFGEVLDSSMGYEFPILVRTEQELKLWFGDNFKEYDYLRELLQEKVVLYLSTPISPELREDLKNSPDWIDLNTFSIYSEEGEEVIFTNEQLFPENGIEGKIYKTIDGKEYIWILGSYILTSYLPQSNILNTSDSFNNRDTLNLGYLKGSTDPLYSYPQYNSENIEENINWENCKDKISDLQDSQNYTLAFDIIWPEDTDEGYLIIENKLFHSNTYDLPTSGFNEDILVTSIDDLKKKLSENWILEGNTLISSSPLKVTYFYNWGNLEITPNKKKTRSIIDNSLTPIIKLWSRTIGRPREDEWEEDDINLKIEEIELGKYRISISRYDLLEVYEGTLEDTPERIDYQIEEKSKLVHAEIPEDLDIEIPRKLQIGNYRLRGATEIKPLSSEWFKNALSRMTEGESELYPDFFLIPDLSKWYTNPEALQEIYKNWINISIQYSLQFLIQNNSSNYSYNLTSDYDNRLVWFFGDMTVYGMWKPAYYIFIRGLLQDIYSLETTKILYLNPNIIDPYEETSIEKSLIEKKSNYLVCNNIKYYYKAYQNGPKYTTTIWMRFVLGKITRELEKNKGKYLTTKSVGKIIEEVEIILRSIETRFSIIRSIGLTSYNVNYKTQSVNLTVSTTISDLIENSLTLDINLNLKT